MLPNDKLNKGARIYVDSALSAATHPIRKNILKLLKKKSLSTIDIENNTKENRYNLYHHLNVLEKSGLIKVDNKKTEGKLKFYQMNYPKKPIMAAFNFDRSEIKEKNNLCNKLYKIIEELEDYDLPNTKKICKVEVYLTYNWE